MGPTVTATAPKTRTQTTTKTRNVETVVLPPPPVPPRDVIALLETQVASDTQINRRCITITITAVLLYIIPEDWNVAFSGLLIEDLGTHASFLLTLAMLWIMRTIPLELLHQRDLDELIAQCKASLAPEDLAIVEVREENRKYIPPLRSGALRFLSGIGWTFGVITSVLLFIFVLSLVVRKLVEVLADAVARASQGEETALAVAVFIGLLIINILGYLISCLVELLGFRGRPAAKQ